MKSGNLNFLKPSGPLQACNGIALPFAVCPERLVAPCYTATQFLLQVHKLPTQIDFTSPDLINQVKTNIITPFTCLNAINFDSIALHLYKTVLFHSYAQQVCQSNSQHSWVTLLRFSKVTWKAFICLKTNLWTVLFKHFSDSYFYSTNVTQITFLNSKCKNLSGVPREYC